MPYLEVLGPPAGVAEKQAAVRAVTEAVVSAFSVSPATVTVYFLPVQVADYGHEGTLGLEGRQMRVFAKMHAYRRGVAERRKAAVGITQALATCFGADPDDVAVYFMDRTLDEVAHGGGMACDDAAEAARVPVALAK
ncbi:hypothetical protein GCM10007301_32510 [Azorhizobium oxalatiphilum]|uniref:4-oxalocrotonate tautomerase n=1 Tax=Azorhizobium oxalatiphilum TaxID=980631 RepID=A0A917FDY8_9HYPH|nr:hypothetical protein [Azorhizobium oxalatiphilum]GGF70221.1 hypothetical protein GCM10007301_32510 [Azorhizobium oxalatiphilum]